MVNGKPSAHRQANGLPDIWPSEGMPAPHFDIVIVGSGYGGSVAAANLAGKLNSETGMPLNIALLERGKEYLPGEFPARFGQLPAHVRLANAEKGTISGEAEGLFDVHTGNDVVALVASGLGGGSLINAGVLLQPDIKDFDNDPLMHHLVSDLERSGHYQRALYALGGVVSRHGASTLNTISSLPGNPLEKSKALQRLKGDHPFEYPPLSVSMDGGVNGAGIQLPACNRCGDCLTGCNTGAKDSLDTNLLALAAQQPGFRIITGASVLSVTRPRTQENWVIATIHTDPKLQSRETGPLCITADKVVLAAGSLGSTDILLRSRSQGLNVSPRLGERFSCNGDNIAAVYKLPVRANGFADEDQPPEERDVGPTITSSISMPGRPENRGTRGFKVQEFSVPGALKQVAEELITTAALVQRLPNRDTTHHTHAQGQKPDPLAVSPQDMAHTLVVGIIGHDDAQGTLRLPHPHSAIEEQVVPGVVNIHWPQARTSPDVLFSDQSLKKLAAKLEGDTSAVPNPMWQILPDELKKLVSQPYGPVLTVHPLGGCSMGHDMSDGVVDTEGRVLTQEKWFGSLVVLDGAVLRGSLGVNPALTIAATAFRAMNTLVPLWTGKEASLPRQLDGNTRRLLPIHVAPSHTASTPTEIEIVERLSGPVQLHVGHSLPQPCIVELTLAYDPFQIKPWLQHFGRFLNISQRRSPSTLRIFKASDWEGGQLRVQADATRHDKAIFEATVTGQLKVLGREASSPLKRVVRSTWAWLINRGMRDIVQRPADDGKSLVKYVGELLQLATRAGEVRLFEYELKVQTIHKMLSDDEGRDINLIPPGSLIHGHKRITYNRRANPWRQLTELTLTRMPAMSAGSPKVLTLDPRFLADQDLPLIRITQQQDQTKAWLDLASLGLLFTRVLLSTHLWTFRKPDDPLDHEPQRLPGQIAALAAPAITELVVDTSPELEPIKIRLTHYRAPNQGAGSSGKAATRPPLVMIHGYSVSGNTFTHPSLQPSAAEFFCLQGRDVWVVDLRTSTGLPTATQAWSMEQVALIDIPAAITHIRNASQCQVDVLAHCIGCVMLSMAMLTSSRDVRTNSIQLGAGVFLTDAQLAILDNFNWRLPELNGPHPCVRKIILSQKGPVLRYTDSNIFRAYLLQSVRRWLLNDEYQFRKSANPSLAEELADRLLASVPYPDREYDIENPCFPPWKQVPWTGTRHRMDALYGRDFNATQLSDATLNAIDDLFGPINMDTLAQTIHFNRTHAITNQRGRGEFVTPASLSKRWHDVPTLAIHGKDNGLVDVSTQDLLTANMRKGGVPFRALPSDAPPYNALGHQDVLIGTSSEQVFQDLEDFLSEKMPIPLANQESPAPDFELDLPWIGPRMVLPGAGSRLKVACMAHPSKGKASLVLVPVVKTPVGLRCALPANQVVSINTLQARASGLWLFAKVTTPVNASQTGLLAMLVYASDQTLVDSGATWLHPPASARQPPTLCVSATAIDTWLCTQTGTQLELACVNEADLERTRNLLQPHAQSDAAMSIAVCSCQYPANLLDALPAGKSLTALSQQVDQGHIGLVLMLGDQIYSDATAGLADPTRRDELYEQPHDRSFRFAPMRDLLRKVPTRTLPDDHEIRDNWEPLPAAVQSIRPQAQALNDDKLLSGMRAWRRFQGFYNRKSHRDQVAVADQSFALGGVPFFLADTRTGRSARGSHVPATEQHILSDTQWSRLFAWMLQHRDDFKYVATPSMLLPRRETSARSPHGHAHSDSWDGYPQSLHKLLHFMVTNGIRNTVFLSGDEHHSLFSEIKVCCEGHTPLKTVSVHSSALYAPLPFANGRPEQLVPAETFSLQSLTVTVTSTFANPGDGFAVLTPKWTPGQASPVLDICFHKPAQPVLGTSHLIGL